MYSSSVTAAHNHYSSIKLRRGATVRLPTIPATPSRQARRVRSPSFLIPKTPMWVPFTRPFPSIPTPRRASTASPYKALYTPEPRYRSLSLPTSTGYQEAVTRPRTVPEPCHPLPPPYRSYILTILPKASSRDKMAAHLSRKYYSCPLRNHITPQNTSSRPVTGLLLVI